MARLHQEDGGANLKVEIVESPEVEDFIDTHAQILDSSFEQVPLSDKMRRALQESDRIFSGYKAFCELGEAFPSLIDENGNKKPFNQFLNDVKKIDQTYNERYLRAEYNFAEASGYMASKWEDYAKDGDEYYLQYRTANDGQVRPEHAALHGVTLPQSDDFWDTYYPPNGWNCRCTVVQVLKREHTPTSHEEAIRRGSEALTKDRKGMFRFNPGKQEKIFPDYNPYTISKCTNCTRKNDISLALNLKVNLAKSVPDSELCAACPMIRENNDYVEEKNGKGLIKIHKLVDRKASDYEKIYSIAKDFSKDGSVVEILPKKSRYTAFKYESLFRDLTGTKYEGKCPDLRKDGVYYEHEGYTSAKPKNAFRNMLNNGLQQSSRIVIDEVNLTDAFMKRSIKNRIYRYHQDIDEVWIKGANGTRLLYKKLEE